MRKCLASVAAFAILALAPCLAVAAAGTTPGMWEIKTSSKVKGMPFATPAVTVKECIKENRSVPFNSSDNKNCSFSDITSTGSSVTWKSTCKEGDTTTVSKGSITYKGDTFSGTIEVSLVSGGKTSEMTQTISGKRTGDCK